MKRAIGIEKNQLQINEVRKTKEEINENKVGKTRVSFIVHQVTKTTTVNRLT